jgi:flagellar motor switch protein FliG
LISPKIKLLPSVLLLLLCGSIALAQSAEEREWELEKLIEARIKKSLSTLLRPDEFYIYVDLRPLSSGKKESPRTSKDSFLTEDGTLEGMDKNLPGLPRVPSGDEPSIDMYSLPMGTTRDESSFREPTEETYTRDVTLILNNEIDSEKINLITGLVSKTAQIDRGRGDKIAIKLVDYKLEPTAKELSALPTEVPSPEQLAAPTSGLPATTDEEKTKGFLHKNKPLVMGLAGLLLLFFILFLILLLKRRGPTLKDAQIMRDAQQFAPPVPPMISPSTTQTPAIPVAAAATESQKSKRDEEAAKQLTKELLKQDVINSAYGRPEAVAQILRTWINEENGLRNAAAVIRSMGLETASSLMKAVSSDIRNKVFSYYGNASEWKLEEELLALEKFSNGLMAQKIQSMTQPEAGEDEYFAFLKKMNDYQIYFMVKDEEPPVIALLLAHIPPDRASKLLAQFEEKKRIRLAVELGNLNSVDTNILNAITKRLAEKSLHIPKLNFTPGMGVNSLVACIDQLDLVAEKRILEAVKEKDTELSEKIRKTYFFFDDLANLTQDALKAILREIPKNTLTASLVGVDERIMNAIVKLLPERKAEMVAFEMQKLKGLPASERVSAQKEFVRVVREMIKKGELDLEKAFVPGGANVQPLAETPDAPQPARRPQGPPPSAAGMNPRTTMPPNTGIRPKATETTQLKASPKPVNPGPTNES